MLKVHSLLPEKYPFKQAGIQTDFLLPKVQRNMATTMSCMNSKGSFHRMNLSSKLEQQTGIGLNCSLGSSQMFASSSGFFKQGKQKNKKENSTHIETKNFKFLALQQKTIKQVIVRYLYGCIQLKKDQKVLSKRIFLPYFKRTQQIQRESQSLEPILVSIPKGSQLEANLQEIIIIIKNIYKQKKPQEQTQRTLFKKISLTIQRIITQKNHIQLLSDSQIPILQQYLEKYIEEIERQKIPKKYGDNNFLMKFYEQIYKRYETIPFITDNKLQQSIENHIFTPSSKQKETIKQEPENNLRLKKKKMTRNQSTVKMRFYNNFKKQIQILSSNTEIIVTKEMNRLNQM